jgi:hypothetical protein
MTDPLRQRLACQASSWEELCAPDGEGLDAYVLGVDTHVSRFRGTLSMVRRTPRA